MTTTISVPFSFSRFGGVETTDDPHKVARQEITNVLLTDRYERVMAPSYGASTSQLLFQTLDSLVVADFKDEAVAMLNKYLSNSTAMDMSISDTPPDLSGGPVADPDATMYVTVSYQLHSELAVSTISVAVVNPTTITATTPL